MQIELTTNYKCPKCQRELTIPTTFWGAVFFSSLVETFEEEIKKRGATISCPHCKKKSYIEPEKD